MKSVISRYFLIICLAIILNSCNKDDTPVSDPGLLKVNEAVSSGSSFKVAFYATDSLFVGYNKVFFKILDNSSGLGISKATLALHPLMNMGTYSHACPLENPAGDMNALGYFEGAILFSMPGKNSWSLSADVTANGKSETVNFQIDNVKATSPVKKMVVIDSLSNGSGGWIITKYPISILPPPNWKVGINLFEITIHTMASMMSFPIVTDMTVEIDPNMPSMGHGSPNNVNPVHTANGHYAGSVNFTMTGAWRINMVIKKGDRVISNKAYFDVVF